MENAIALLDIAMLNGAGLSLVVLGILISIRFLGYPDLTCDGSFTLGAALYATLSLQGANTLLSLLLVLGVGALAGGATSFLNQHLHIGKVVSSIIVMLLAILLVPYFAGGGTIGLLGTDNLFSDLTDWDRSLGDWLALSTPIHFITVAAFYVITIILTWLVVGYFASSTGLQIRYLGSAGSPTFLSPRRRRLLTYVGLCLGNATIALGGALEAQKNGGFNQHMGTGMLLIGLTVLILGESLVKVVIRRDYISLRHYLVVVLLGTLIYTLGIQVLLHFDLLFFDVKLATTLLLLVLVAGASLRHSNRAQLF
jgi:putative ABC transport system permease protein